jgi:hypothetical protein
VNGILFEMFKRCGNLLSQPLDQFVHVVA